MSAPTLPTVGFRTNAKWNITEGGPVYALYALAPEFLELQLAPDFTIELLKVDVPGQQTTGTVMGGQQSDQSLARGRQHSQRPSRVDLRRDQRSSPSVGRHHDQRIKKNHAIIRVQFKEEITIEGVVYKGAHISMDTLEVEKWSEEDIKNRFMLHWQCEHAIDDAQKPCDSCIMYQGKIRAGKDFFPGSFNIKFVKFKGSHKSSVSDANFRLLEDLEPKDGNAIILTLGTILSLPIDHKMDYFLFRYIKSKATATANPLAGCRDFV
ncbi:hypothetical protein H0H92_012477, partial [Tricholoma furcatifolium]